MTDLDKGGRGFQRVRTYLGPSLGWTEELVQPTTEILVGGPYNVQSGDSLILVNCAAAVQINLPDVRLWIQQTANQPATGFDRSLTIKDIGGNAANFNIVIAPFGQQDIDNIAQAILITIARGAVKLIPLIDLTGWAVGTVTAAGGGGGGGGGDVFKAGNNTYTGTNTYTNTTIALTEPTAEESEKVATTRFVKNQNYLTSISLAPYAPLFSPAFIGAPTAPTPSPSDNDQTLVTIGFVEAALAGFTPGAPINAEYLVGSPTGVLTGSRAVVDSASISWDRSIPGQIKAFSSAGGGNVSSVGTPLNGQFARWVTSSSIEGVTAAGLGFQPLDGDLTAISGLTGTNTVYYRSAPEIWSPVTFSGLSFSGGVLTVTAGGGNVNSSGVPTNLQLAQWTDPTHIQGINISSLGFAPIANPVFTGDPQAPTPATADNDTSIATTAFVKAQGYAPLASPVFTGDPRAPTPAASDNDTSIATTAFVKTALGPGGFVNVQKFIANGTYTPSPNTQFVIVECIGGGAGGGAAITNGSFYYGGGGGGSGGYSRSRLTAAQIGASQVVSIGTAGIGTGGFGQNGGQTSFGALVTANGGFGGSPSNNAGPDTGAGGAGAAIGTGDIAFGGAPGHWGFFDQSTGQIYIGGGAGGSSAFGGGATASAPIPPAPSGGQPANNFGSGGGGAQGGNVPGSYSGGAGSAGICIITEYNITGAQGPAGPPGGAQGVSPPMGRLTLQTGTPVMNSAQIGKTTIFYTPYEGDRVPIYDGSIFNMTPFTEISVLTTDTTKNPSAIAANKVNDWFVWSDNGIMRLSHGPDWTNDTTRSAGTALVRQNGIWLNNVAITNGPAAAASATGTRSAGTYVGTSKSFSDATVNWNPPGGYLGVWNTYNRVDVHTQFLNSANAWQVTVANTWQPLANGPGTYVLSFVRGLNEDSVSATMHQSIQAPDPGSLGAVAWGLDSTTVTTGTIGNLNGPISSTITANYSGTPGLGWHNLQMLQFAIGSTGGVNFYGNALVNYYQSGYVSMMRA